MTTNENNLEASTIAANGLQQATGIIWTVSSVLNYANHEKEALPASAAGALGEMLGKAKDRLAMLRDSSELSNLEAAAHILSVSHADKIPVSPTISGALTDILLNVMESNTMYAAALQKRVMDELRDESAGLMELVKMGGLKDEKLRKQILAHAINLLREVADLKKNVDGLEKEKTGKAAFLAEVEANRKERDAMAAEKGLRVPDWRDGASAAEDDPDTARGEQISLFPDEDKPSKPAKPEVKPAAKPAPKKGTRHFAVLNDEGKPVVGVPDDKPAKEKVKPDGTVEVSGFFSPEEKEKLIANIREYLSGLHDGHRLSELVENIKLHFNLLDGEIGELIGVSDRLITHVRHGRPSPFTLARFTEVFGTDGGTKEEK